MSGLLQQAKRAARAFGTATHFIAIAHLRIAKLKILPGAGSAETRLLGSTLNAIEPN